MTFAIAGWSWNSQILDIIISIEVMEISGTIVSYPQGSQEGLRTGEIASIVVGAFLLVLAIASLLFFLIRAARFSDKVDSIKGGMSYDEVIKLLGEPKTYTEFEGIRTCSWSRAVIRGVFTNHTVTFKNGKVVSVDGHTNFGVE